MYRGARRTRTRKYRESLVGQESGQLTAIEEAPSHRAPSGAIKRRWKCKCACGNLLVVFHQDFVRKSHKRCKACSRKYLAEIATTHGDSCSAEYNVWRELFRRCYDERRKGYEDYGSRGIEVCERWFLYENFLADMGRKPSAEHQIDRKNTNGNYEPDNCRWATPHEQRRNRRDNQWLEIDGIRMIVTDWARSRNISPSLLRWRIKNHWSPERLFLPSDSRRGRRSDTAVDINATILPN